MQVHLGAGLFLSFSLPRRAFIKLKTNSFVTFDLPDSLHSSVHWETTDDNNSKYPNNSESSMIDWNRRWTHRRHVHGWLESQSTVPVEVDSMDRQDADIDRRRDNSPMCQPVFCLTIDRVTCWETANLQRWSTHQGHWVRTAGVAVVLRELASVYRVIDRVNRRDMIYWYDGSHRLPRRSVRSSLIPVESVANAPPVYDCSWFHVRDRSVCRSVSRWIDVDENEENQWEARSICLNHWYCWTSGDRSCNSQRIRFASRSENLRGTLSRRMQSIASLPITLCDSPDQIWRDCLRLFDWICSSWRKRGTGKATVEDGSDRSSPTTDCHSPKKYWG